MTPGRMPRAVYEGNSRYRCRTWILAVVNRETKKECTYLFEETARAKQNVAFRIHRVHCTTSGPAFRRGSTAGIVGVIQADLSPRRPKVFDSNI